MFDELTEKNLLLYAARHYHKPLGASSEEFEEDLKKFKYIKRLVNRYLETNELAERLIMNHLIVVFNVFGIEAGVKILGLKLEGRHWPVIKPFLVYLKYLQSDEFTNITMDENVVSILRKEFR